MSSLPGAYPEPEAAPAPKNWILVVFHGILYVPLNILYIIATATLFVVNKLFPKIIPNFGAHHALKIQDTTFTTNNAHIDWLENCYTESLYIAQSQAKFLMIYLHDDQLDDDEIMLNQSVLDFVKMKDILLWGQDVCSSEGFQIANALGVTQFPFIGLLALKFEKTQTPHGTAYRNLNTMELVWRHEGTRSFNLLELKTTVQKLEPVLATIRQDFQEHETARVMRQQQDDAYNESLRRDQERDRQREFAEKCHKWLLNKAATLAEPQPGQDACRVAIKFADGSRVIRKFDAEHTVDEIYVFVELYKKGLLESGELSDVEDVEYPFDFKLVSSRQELMFGTVIREDSNIYPSGNILVTSE